MHRPTRFALVLALAIAAPAMAHNRIELATPALDLRFEATAPESVQPLRIVPRDLFAEVAHIELPLESIADQLKRRFRVRSSADVSPTLRIFTSAVNEKLASGLLTLRDQNNVSEIRKIGAKTRWDEVFGALPFTDPATGLVYARARWLDPTTGTFLSADPAGYRDSSNLYAYCGGDPVNCSDPTGMFGWRDVTDFWDAWRSLGSSWTEIKKTAKRTGASFAGAHVGAAKAVGGAIVAPVANVVHSVRETSAMAGGAIAAYQHGGMAELKQFADEESQRQQLQAKEELLNLPFIGTARSFGRALDEYENENYFAGGMEMGETIARAEGDAALVYGGVRGVQSFSAARAARTYTPSMRVNLLNPANPKFGPNDLVYGLYETNWPGGGARFNPTEALRQRAGGRLLSDFSVPAGQAYEYSVRAMEDTVANGNTIRFNITYVDTDAAFGEYGPHANSITSMELRYIRQNWSRFQNNVRFYRLNKVVAPPWMR